MAHRAPVLRYGHHSRLNRPVQSPESADAVAFEASDDLDDLRLSRVAALRKPEIRGFCIMRF